MDKPLHTIALHNPSRWRDACARFLHSNWLYVLLTAITVIGWALDWTVPALVVLLLLFSLVLLVSRDTTPAIAVFLSIYFTFSPSYTTFAGNEWMIALLVIPVAAVIAHLCLYRPKLRVRGFGFAMMIVTIPWVLQGLGRRIADSIAAGSDAIHLPLSVVWVGYVITAGLGILYFLFYLFLDSTAFGEKGQLAETMCRTMVYTAVVITLQTVIQVGGFLHAGKSVADIFVGKMIDLGWGCQNNIAAYFSITLPITAYFAIKCQKTGWLYLLFALVQYAIILLTFSRGPMIFVTFALPFILLYVFVKSNNRQRIGHTVVLVVFMIGAAAFAYFKRNELLAILSRVVDKGLSDSGRFNIYAGAWLTFKRNPLFGGGMDVYYYTDAIKETMGGFPASWAGQPYLRSGIVYWFHSTLCQIIANFGVVGIIAYLYQYLYRYTLMLRAPHNARRVATLAAMLLFEAYGLIDTCFFSPMMYLIIMLLTLGEDRADGYKPIPYLTAWLPMRTRKWLLVNAEPPREPADLEE